MGRARRGILYFFAAFRHPRQEIAVKRIAPSFVSVTWLVLLGGSCLLASPVSARIGTEPKPGSITRAHHRDFEPLAPSPAAQAKAREEMIRTTIAGRGINDPRVLQAMRAELREEYLPERSAPSPTKTPRSR